jgi:hypothetical protein
MTITMPRVVALGILVLGHKSRSTRMQIGDVEKQIGRCRIRPARAHT